MDKIESALKNQFSLHDAYYIMDILDSYRKVEDSYINDEEGFKSFLFDNLIKPSLERQKRKLIDETRHGAGI